MWNKIDLIHFSKIEVSWAQHSLLQPTPILINQGHDIRIFCGMRDEYGRSRVGFIDVSAKDPLKVINYSKHPCLDIGQPGMFDDNGVVPCAIRKDGNDLYLYYAGYFLGQNVRFLVFSGLAVSHDMGINFERYQLTPLLERSHKEPLFRVIHTIHDKGPGYQVWYGAGEAYQQGKDKTLPIYNVRTMHSEDGKNFPSYGSLALDIQGNEHRIGRPFVIECNNGFIMFYGYGSDDNPYQLGYAVSKDGDQWQRRDDKFHFDKASANWENEMQAYPSVIETAYGTYLFYNGNQYGKDGIGCARLKGTLEDYIDL